MYVSYNWPVINLFTIVLQKCVDNIKDSKSQNQNQNLSEAFHAMMIEQYTL